MLSERTQNTILITGCSSGFGLETARYFLDRDWTVVATMRDPHANVLPASDRLRVLELDVTDAQSIARAVDAAGPVDVVVNNAGVGLINALEGTSIDLLREVFETNTIGTIAMTKAFVPQLRERGSGVVINVTSSVTLRSLRLLSVYTASKAAINAFTESLALELEPFGVRARLVIPGGASETSFGANARANGRLGKDLPDAYADQLAQVTTGMQQPRERFTRSSDVAEAVWRAATDPSCPMRLYAGADAIAWAEAV